MLGQSLFLFLCSVADVRLVSGIEGGLLVFGDKFSSFSFKADWFVMSDRRQVWSVTFYLLLQLTFVQCGMWNLPNIVATNLQTRLVFNYVEWREYVAFFLITYIEG